MKKIYMTLVMLFAITASMAQPREIKGVVHDENDKPMSGVTVYVQETGAGTITGSKGTYSIKIPNPKSEITFSFMGYKTLKLKADDPKAKFDIIKLLPDQQMLDAVEVVVEAGGRLHKQRRRHTLEVERGAELLLKIPFQAADGGLRLVQIEKRLIAVRDHGFAHHQSSFRS